MSRLFDALQRSEGAGFNFEFPMPAPPITEAAPAPQPNELSRNGLGQFPSLRTSISAGSRLVCLTDQDSLGAEKFRFLAVRLRQLQQARSLKKLLITSTIPEEGKSMVSANLAVTLAIRRRQNVLLLEGDLRRPGLVQQFGLNRVAGLGEWLRGDPTPTRNIYFLEEVGLWFLPAGHPPENPLELMQSARLAELMEQLAEWFDWIVIDSPPVLPLGDTSVWTKLSDGILLVAREGKTETKQLQRGLEAIDRSKVVGLVLNSCNSADHRNYYQRYGPAARK